MFKYYSYDIEIMKNFFSITFINNQNTKEKQIFIISKNRTEEFNKSNFLSLKKFVINKNYKIKLSGYNNASFDDIILNYILMKEEFDNDSFINDIFYYSDLVIKNSNLGILYYDESTRNSILFNRNNKYYISIDLMKIYDSLDSKRISLKQVAIALKWPKIQDMPYSFKNSITLEQEEEIIDYNVNDTLITNKLLHNSLDILKLRDLVSHKYNINVLSDSKSKIANKILSSYYSKETGLDYKDFKGERTFRSFFRLKECIFPNIQFKSEFFNKELESLKEIVIDGENTKSPFDKTITFDGVTYTLGVGGLHSQDNAGYFESNDKEDIIDADVSSYYPRIMIEYGIKPEHLSNKFLDILKTITEQRLEAKKNKDSITADSLKIVINSTFGKLGSKLLWLYDPKAMIEVTINGQLFLLMLIEELVLNGIKVISANTDGILSIVPKDKKELYDSICKNWQKYTSMDLEFIKYNKYIRRDVNAYISIEQNTNKVKTKGIFNNTIDIEKGYDKPIVSIALYNYYVNNIPIEETIYNHKDIYDFCISQKIGSQFNMVTRDIKNGTIQEKKIQKTNRFFVSKGGILIQKKKSDNKYDSIVAKKSLTLFNDYYEVEDFKDYRIDYKYYINSTRDIVNLITPNIVQKTLF